MKASQFRSLIKEEIRRKQELNKAEREAYHKSKLEEAKVYGEKRAKFETERKLQKLKNGSKQEEFQKTH
jgi:hypothetical protein